jgi:asparagine synthase (glutamine-hydrolysing)
VSLSGDGGDELFWGYPQRSADVIANASDFRMPLWLRRVRSGVRTALGRGTAPSLAQPTIGDWYATRHTCLKNGWFERIFPGTQPVTDLLDGFRFAGSDRDETAQWVRYNEFVYHLTMVLLKVDRASMHCSQEVRVPLLDKEVIEAASMVDWNSCLAIKTRTGKQPLRQILARRANYQSQRKMGFEAPMGSWLRGPLREQFESLVMGREHIFDHRIDRKEMNRLWKIHQSGERDFAFGLWPVLSLALWENAHFSRRAT